MLPEWLAHLHTVSEIGDGRTRQANKLFVPRTNISAGDRSFNVRDPNMWNKLPLSITNDNGYSVFKTKLKKYLLFLQHQN